MSRRSEGRKPEFVFLPLGGVGEIGMNLYLYGYGPEGARDWLIVDMGITFGGDYEPGIDVILPDITFLEEERPNLVGLLLTHAHEDHFGAVADLWPRLGNVPVYATPFTASMLKSKLAENGRSRDLPLKIMALGERRKIGPFDVELINMSHSIPEPSAVVLRTELGTVLHSGDWKLDETPLTSAPTDKQRLIALGDEGVDALICDSTNAVRDGVSASEADVAVTLETLIRKAPRRVAVTTFASNVARISSVAKAASAAGRELIVVGRAMYRVIEAAQETGYLDPDLAFHAETEFENLNPRKVVALCTGSQGEARAAMARIALNEHPNVKLEPGDQVIFSSRTIPGNEKAVGRVQNGLSDMGVDVITDQDALVHVSGHPRRGELEQLYRWIRPKIAVPMHGEGRHLEAHARLAERLGVPEVVRVRNGAMVRLLPGPPAIIDEVPVGRLYRDGTILTRAADGAVRERRKLSFAGSVAVSLVMSEKGVLLADPEIALQGLPAADLEGTPFETIARDAAIGTVASIPKPRRKDPALVSEAVRRSIRAAVNQAWGKKPVCSVLVTVL
jgi:ribonuclease J